MSSIQLLPKHGQDNLYQAKFKKYIHYIFLSDSLKSITESTLKQKPMDLNSCINLALCINTLLNQQVLLEFNMKDSTMKKFCSSFLNNSQHITQATHKFISLIQTSLNLLSNNSSDVSTASKAPEIQYLEFSTDHFSPKSGFLSGVPVSTPSSIQKGQF